MLGVRRECWEVGESWGCSEPVCVCVHVCVCVCVRERERET